LARDGITKVEVFPVGGRGNALSQPTVLRGREAQAVLQDIKDRSAKLATTVQIVGDVGVVTVAGGPRAGTR